MAEYKPIPRRKLSHEVRDQLLDMISSGQIPVGSRLPSEHDLMSKFQVGRPAVREALQALENIGLISIQHGERARVTRPSADGMLSQLQPIARQLLQSSSQNVKHLLEARQTFEAGVVRLAAIRRDEKQLELLKTTLEKMQEYSGKPEFRKYDQQFHIIVAEMTGNPIFSAVLKAIFQWLSGYFENLLVADGLEDLTIQEHIEIYMQIHDGNPEEASRAISEHILRINDQYYGVTMVKTPT